MGQYWTRKGDQEDKDERTICPWTEVVGHGDRTFSAPKDEDEEQESVTCVSCSE
ncbi:MAG: hypothetical protein J6P96_01805 [Bacteroidaceae bacterium]|nr:hypothetical protein [Bacteroidaceae bacterium]MBO5964622.1 hypothetical protein [Bacteroidaceae bacterium]